jgi:hypothetical protein
MFLTITHPYIINGRHFKLKEQFISIGEITLIEEVGQNRQYYKRPIKHYIIEEDGVQYRIPFYACVFMEKKYYPHEADARLNWHIENAQPNNHEATLEELTGIKIDNTYKEINNERKIREATDIGENWQADPSRAINTREQILKEKYKKE